MKLYRQIKRFCKKLNIYGEILKWLIFGHIFKDMQQFFFTIKALNNNICTEEVFTSAQLFKNQLALYNQRLIF